MFRRNKFNGIVYCDPTPGAAGASSGTNTGQAGQQVPGQTQNLGQQNNGQNNLTQPDDIANIWSNEPSTGQQQPAQPTQQQQQPNQNAQIPDNTTIQNTFQQHWDSLGIMQNVDIRGLADQISQNQNPEEAISKAFNTFGQNVYKQALLAINKITENHVKQAEERLRQSATGELRADLAVSRMNEQLKFTSDPMIAPVAKAALNQFLKKGQDLPTAIANVGKYFESVHKNVGKHFTSNGTNAGNQRHRGFIDPDVAADEAQTVDWLKLLNS